jgi:hypothetical protein
MIRRYLTGSSDTLSGPQKPQHLTCASMHLIKQNGGMAPCLISAIGRGECQV